MKKKIKLFYVDKLIDIFKDIFCLFIIIKTFFWCINWIFHTTIYPKTHDYLMYIIALSLLLIQLPLSYLIFYKDPPCEEIKKRNEYLLGLLYILNQGKNYFYLFVTVPILLNFGLYLMHKIITEKLAENLILLGFLGRFSYCFTHFISNVLHKIFQRLGNEILEESPHLRMRSFYRIRPNYND